MESGMCEKTEHTLKLQGHNPLRLRYPVLKANALWTESAHKAGLWGKAEIQGAVCPVEAITGPTAEYYAADDGSYLAPEDLKQVLQTLHKNVWLKKQWKVSTERCRKCRLVNKTNHHRV